MKAFALGCSCSQIDRPKTNTGQDNHVVYVAGIRGAVVRAECRVHGQSRSSTTHPWQTYFDAQRVSDMVTCTGRTLKEFAVGAN